MKRREFLQAALATGGALSIANAQPSEAQVKRVLVMFKCHFDLGFINTQAAVMRMYFDKFYPLAMQIANQMRKSGEDRYIWTTGSWLLYEYLEQANAEQRKRMEQAVRTGDIAWHALPFNWQTEFLDRSAIVGSLGLSQALDRRFGHTTTGAKMTDVPGHSRGIVGPLAENGVTFLDIGVNSASTPPDVPSMFVWKDPDGKAIIMMYHRRAYGGVVQVPGSDLAVAIDVRNDNSGPHTIPEIHEIYAKLRKQFPNATVRASNLTEIANAVEPYRNQMPVLTQEIGDTWIYGVPSDPVKVARYREMLRLRKRWIENGKFRTADATDLGLLRWLALAAEHTWGTDTKTWLDFDHYTPRDLASMLDQPHYKTVEHSWEEKRHNIDVSVASLPGVLREEAVAQLAKLKPAPPTTDGLQPHRADEAIETQHFIIALDPQTGAIRSLRSKARNRDWASTKNPLALFTYQTLSKQDYDRFLASYVTSKADWAPKDFGKPNIGRFGARSQTWQPKVTECQAGRSARGHRILARLKIDDAEAEQSGVTAWPRDLYLEIFLPNAEPVVHLSFFWFGKQPNRLPEALWLAFQPVAPEPRNWTMTKVDREVSPFDVVAGGNRHMHAITDRITYKDERGGLSIETLDAPVIALGEQSPIYFSNSQPDLTKGIHFSLFNNGWGTNYIQWFGEDMRFRFTLRA